MSIEAYKAWIEQHGSKSPEEAWGRCKEYTDEMAKVFQDLEVRAGYYHCYIWGRRTHWWLITKNGIVVDPTAIQFPSKGTGEYESLNERQRPIGRCINCGRETFLTSPSHEFCSHDCEKETIDDLNGMFTRRI